jgi:threonylcarbamoyladenosine tRNA methylthiotransferase MtaB
MPQIEKQTIKRRATELRECVHEVRDAWLCTLIGTKQRVLAERDGSGYAENFARVAAPAGTSAGSTVEVTPAAIEQGILK